MPFTRLAGVDGCRAGWVLARSDLALHVLDFDLYESFAELLAAHSDPDTLIVVDIPMGLPRSGPRACDIEARKLLGPGRASSVFPAPSRAALAAGTYTEASSANCAATGRGLSRQSYGILPKYSVPEVPGPGRRPGQGSQLSRGGGGDRSNAARGPGE